MSTTTAPAPLPSQLSVQDQVNARSGDVSLSAIVEHLESYTVTSESPTGREVTVTARHETGAELSLAHSGAGPKRRIIVKGHFARSPYSETRAVEQVTMRASLTPVRAAAEITRRLLPTYHVSSDPPPSNWVCPYCVCSARGHCA